MARSSKSLAIPKNRRVADQGEYRALLERARGAGVLPSYIAYTDAAELHAVIFYGYCILSFAGVTTPFQKTSSNLSNYLHLIHVINICILNIFNICDTYILARVFIILKIIIKKQLIKNYIPIGHCEIVEIFYISHKITLLNILQSM